MLKKWLAIIIASLAMFNSAPIAFADNINNSPNITTNSNSSQGLTLNKKAASQATKAGKKAGKSSTKFSDRLYKQGSNSVDAVKSVSSEASKRALEVSGDTVSLPGSANSLTGVVNRCRIGINWLGQNGIAILMMLLMFGLVIVIIILIGRILAKLINIGKTPLIKLIFMLIGAIIILAIVQGFSGLFGYGFGFYRIINWILTGQ